MAEKTCATCGLPKDAERDFWADRSRRGGLSRDCKGCVRARSAAATARKQAALKGMSGRRPDPLPAQPVPDRAPDTRMHRLQLQLDKHWDKLCAKAIEAALAGDRQMLKYLMEVAANASSNTGKLGLILGELYERRLDRLARAGQPLDADAPADAPDDVIGPESDGAADAPRGPLVPPTVAEGVPADSWRP